MTDNLRGTQSSYTNRRIITASVRGKLSKRVRFVATATCGRNENPDFEMGRRRGVTGALVAAGAAEALDRLVRCKCGQTLAKRHA